MWPVKRSNRKSPPATRRASRSPRKLLLHVLEQTTVDGKVGEREVERHELATDEKQGQGRLTLRLEKGGKYILRVEGTDRFKNPISAAHVVRISDDNDAVRLRILADKHTFKVGDTARVQLHWREAPALALVTFQGARVLDYKLVDLKQGANELQIPLTAALAPNFELAVAVMTDAQPPQDPEARARFRRFHEASSPFAVERELRVTLETKPKAAGQTARPGDDVDVTITTTDPQGKPVSAELSLALIEQSLHDRFGSRVAGHSRLFPRSDSRARRADDVKRDVRLSPQNAADQPATAGGKGPAGNRRRRGGTVENGSGRAIRRVPSGDQERGRRGNPVRCFRRARGGWRTRGGYGGRSCGFGYDRVVAVCQWRRASRFGRR